MVSAYSIGKSQRSQSLSETERNPGPGQYKIQIEPLSNKLASPKWSITGTRRNTLDKARFNSTGPGQYDPNYSQQYDKPPSYKIAQTERASMALEQSRNVPGPGRYQTNDTFQGPKVSNPLYVKFTIGEKLKEPKLAMGPGPQSYRLKINILEEAKNIKIGNSPRESLANDNKVPGPGFYNTSTGFHIPSMKFGNETRESFHKFGQSNSPGPGAYDTRDRFTSRNSPRCKIGTENRDFSYDNFRPGPGQYEVNHHLLIDTAPRYKMGRSQRTSLEKSSSRQVPGPGSYKLSQTFGGPRFTMPGKFNSLMETRKYAPGPGTYNFKDKSHIYPSIKFGTEPRKMFESSNQSPGPGTYKLKPTFADVPHYLLPLK